MYNKNFTKYTGQFIKVFFFFDIKNSFYIVTLLFIPPKNSNIENLFSKFPIV